MENKKELQLTDYVVIALVSIFVGAFVFSIVQDVRSQKALEEFLAEKEQSENIGAAYGMEYCETVFASTTPKTLYVGQSTTTIDCIMERSDLSDINLVMNASTSLPKFVYNVLFADGIEESNTKSSTTRNTIQNIGTWYNETAKTINNGRSVTYEVLTRDYQPHTVLSSVNLGLPTVTSKYMRIEYSVAGTGGAEVSFRIIKRNPLQ